jgi:hypothetical protein
MGETWIFSQQFSGSYNALNIIKLNPVAESVYRKNLHPQCYKWVCKLH